MKRFTAGLLMAATMFNGAGILAADTSIASITIDPDTQYITVSGKVNSDNDRDRVTLRVTKADEKPGEGTILCTYQVNTNENGEYSFGFSMPDNCEAAEYDAHIKVDGADEAQQSFEFFGDVSSVLENEINKASSESALRSILEADNGMEMFGISDDEYNALSDIGKAFVISAVYNTKKALGGFENGKHLRDTFEQALLIAKIREDKADLTDDNIEILTVDYSNPDDDDYGSYLTMYETAKTSGIEAIAIKAVKSDEVEDAKTFWTVYNDAVTKNVISKCEYWTEVKDFIDDNKELISEKADVDWDEYGDNTQSVCKKFVRGSYSSLESFADALSDATEDVSEGSSGTGNGGSGGSGGGSGSSGIKASAPTFVNTPVASGTTVTPIVTSTTYIFDDLRRTPWANEAVTKLVESQIINGYGDSTFRPERNITREEFVTIVIKAFYPESENMDCGFSDVEKSSWSYPYIAAASNLGLINGIGDNKFGPSMNIKRQDMAVIIANVMDKKGYSINTSVAQVFSDESQVSDYALEAVKALRAQGIVNGDNNNNFNPLSEATRAESAVIIYNVLSK